MAKTLQIACFYEALNNNAAPHRSKRSSWRQEAEKIGSIQEDRHKVEQFPFLWNSSTICGTEGQI